MAEYSRRNSSPDAIFPFPDRPIRPLPKRPLRERLSPEVAGSIKYPPAPKTTTPLFYNLCSVRADAPANGVVESQHPSERERAEETDQRNYISRRNGEELDSDDDEVAYRSRIYSRHSSEPGRSYRYVQPDTKHPKPQAPASTASSADGYDSFENTNNKKKRKIPTPGDSNVNGVHLSNEMASMGLGLDSADDSIAENANSAAYYTTSPSNHGISGSLRARYSYGRSKSGRSPPRRSLSDISISGSWVNGRNSKQRATPSPQRNVDNSGIGIISTAIANAEKLPIAPSRGQENASLFQQHASKKSSPASTQFTFTCDSSVANTPPWPRPSTPPKMNQSPAADALRLGLAQGQGKKKTQGTQTSPATAHMQKINDNEVLAQAKLGLKAIPQAEVPVKKSRRRPSKAYRIAARERRQQQQYQNLTNPPSPESVWICEFCEYERIFGGPPVALIRQYEMKDRHNRKQEADRKRLLEKAKMKGRKGKKGNKPAAKASTAPAGTSTNHQASTNQNPPVHPEARTTQDRTQGTHNGDFDSGAVDGGYGGSDEDDDGEYAEDYPDEEVGDKGASSQANNHPASGKAFHPGDSVRGSGVVT